MRTVIFLLLTACLAFAGCESSVNVAATANVGAQYSSVLVTVKEVWVNENATAVPDDTNWLKFPLSTPQTLDLVDVTSGDLQEVASELDIPTGTYRQMRLFLVDRSEALTESANSTSATFNNQVTFFDASGAERHAAAGGREPAQGIGVEMELRVPSASSAVLAAAATSTSTTTTTTARRRAPPQAQRPVPRLARPQVQPLAPRRTRAAQRPTAPPTRLLLPQMSHSTPRAISPRSCSATSRASC